MTSSSMKISVSRHLYPIKASCGQEPRQIFFGAYQEYQVLAPLHQPKKLLWLCFYVTNRRLRGV